MFFRKFFSTVEHGEGRLSAIEWVCWKKQAPGGNVRPGLEYVGSATLSRLLQVLAYFRSKVNLFSPPTTSAVKSVVPGKPYFLGSRSLIFGSGDAPGDGL